jgi:hypothetical protein
MGRYLVVGNQTLGSDQLRAKIQESIEAGPSQFHIVVPVSHPAGSWSDGKAMKLARERLDQALASFEGLGAKVTGEVGDASPVRAIADVLISDPEPFDEIILSTLPPGPSRWLHQDVLHRVRRTFAVPCTHVVATSERAGATRA